MNQKKFLLSVLLCAWSVSALEKTYVKRMESEDFLETGVKWTYPDQTAFGFGANWADKLQFWVQSEDRLAFDLRAKVFQSPRLADVFVGLNRYGKDSADADRTELYAAIQKQWPKFHVGASIAMPTNPMDFKAGLGLGTELFEHLGLSYEAIYNNKNLNHQAFAEYKRDYYLFGLGAVYEGEKKDPLEAIFSASLRFPLSKLSLKPSPKEEHLEPVASPSLDEYVQKIAELEKRIEALEKAKLVQPVESKAEEAKPAEVEKVLPPRVWDLDSLKSLENTALRALSRPELRDDFMAQSGADDFVAYLLQSPWVSAGLRSAALELARGKNSEALNSYLSACVEGAAQSELRERCDSMLESKAAPKKAPVLPMEESLLKAATVSGSAKDSSLRILARPLAAAPGLLPYLVQSPFTAPSARQAAAKLYSVDAQEAKLPTLRSWLEDRDAKVRRAAAAGLGKAMDLNSAPLLKTLSQNDPKPEVREEAKAALKRIVGGLIGEQGLENAHAPAPAKEIKEVPQPKEKVKSKKKKDKKKKSKKKKASFELPGDHKLPKSEVFPSKGGVSPAQSPKFEPITGHELEDPKPM